VPLTFVTGPVRSGKSRFAERLAMENGGDVTYVATARTDPTDAEWVARIAHHVARRPASWRTIETGLLGAPSLAELAGDGRANAVLLVDSLGTWLAAEMSARFEVGGEPAALDIDALETACTMTADALAASAAHAIVVGDEAGWGLVPPYPSGRVFRDVLGRMQQRLAARAERAYLVVAGYAIDLRAAGRLV
jgi:adenosylcobinamide kinase/adenosylcobinamide-phosphate guanylyltransferase